MQYQKTQTGGVQEASRLCWAGFGAPEGTPKPRSTDRGSPSEPCARLANPQICNAKHHWYLAESNSVHVRDHPDGIWRVKLRHAQGVATRWGGRKDVRVSATRLIPPTSENFRVLVPRQLSGYVIMCSMLAAHCLKFCMPAGPCCSKRRSES